MPKKQKKKKPKQKKKKSGRSGKAHSVPCFDDQAKRLRGVDLDLRDDPVRGRCVVVRRPFRVGELVLQTTAIVQTLLWKHAESRCASCFAQSPSPSTTAPSAFSKCGQCKVAHYCSKKCQTLHWARGHKHTCRAMKALVADGVRGQIKDDLKSELLTLVECLRVARATATAAGDGGGGGGNDSGGGQGEAVGAPASVTASSSSTGFSDAEAAGNSAQPALGHRPPAQQVLPTLTDLLHMHSVDTQRQECASMVAFGIELSVRA